MQIRQYIVEKNPGGVQDWARRNGYAVPKTKDEAYRLLTAIYESPDIDAAQVFAELHPDRHMFESITKNTSGMTVTPIRQDFRNCCGSYGADGSREVCNCASCSMVRNFRNADGTQGMIDRGLASAENAVKETARDIKDAIREQDSRLFKYGALILVGFLMGKYLTK